MNNINLPKTNIQEIDIAKRKLEMRYIPRIKSIFNNLANDAGNFYNSAGGIPIKELATNYNIEFISEIRNIYRSTIKAFGFDIRKTSEVKYCLNFDIEYKKAFFDVEVKQVVEVSDSEVRSKIDEVNTKFQEDATLFIANTSEEKAEYITETNEKLITEAVSVAIGLYSLQTLQLQEDLNNADFGKKKDNLEKKLESHLKNRNKTISNTIKKEINKKAVNRSELIAEDNVGLSEGWSREKEATLINEAEIIVSQTNILKLKKKWNTILDNRTRESHAIADGQTVDVEDFFIVGGEALKYPRDPSGSVGNTIRCRCVSEYITLI